MSESYLVMSKPCYEPIFVLDFILVFVHELFIKDRLLEVEEVAQEGRSG